MKSVTGIFASCGDAEKAISTLRSHGIEESQITLLLPGTPEEEAREAASVPTSDTEQPGMGKAMGGVVGAAMGAAGGLSLGSIAASALIPGVGPVVALGMAGAAALGLIGGVAGVAAGKAIENTSTHGLPKDEIFLYEDALRKGRSVLIVFTEPDKADEVRDLLGQSGAETIDAARHTWWIGLRDVEEENYRASGGDFSTEESVYRRGFETALHPDNRDKAYDEIRPNLEHEFGPECKTECFRRGYERGRRYFEQLREPEQKRAA